MRDDTPAVVYERPHVAANLHEVARPIQEQVDMLTRANLGTPESGHLKHDTNIADLPKSDELAVVSIPYSHPAVEQMEFASQADTPARASPEPAAEEYTPNAPTDITFDITPAPMFDASEALQVLSEEYSAPLSVVPEEAEYKAVIVAEWPEELSTEFIRTVVEYPNASTEETELSAQIVSQFETLEGDKLEAGYELMHALYDTACLLVTSQLNSDQSRPILETAGQTTEELTQQLSLRARELLVGLHLPADKITVEQLAQMILVSLQSKQRSAGFHPVEDTAESNRELQLPTLDSSDDFISHAFRRERLYLSALGKRILTLHAYPAPSYS